MQWEVLPGWGGGLKCDTKGKRKYGPEEGREREEKGSNVRKKIVEK